MSKRIERYVIGVDISADDVPDFVNTCPYTPISIHESIKEDLGRGMSVIVIDHKEEIIYVE